MVHPYSSSPPPGTGSWTVAGLPSPCWMLRVLTVKVGVLLAYGFHYVQCMNLHVIGTVADGLVTVSINTLGAFLLVESAYP